jgi:hypothetical protein
MSSRRDERGRFRTILAVGVLAVVVVVGYLFARGVGPLPDPDGCTAEVGDVSAGIDLEQARYASIIAATAVRRGLPARAASIALATAFQESKLRNVTHGDRDSLGLFQQRPSQGWGTADQVMDPYYATNAFYDALQRIDGYETMRITEAAQRVQRSGYPEAYEEHAAGARALASALTGYSPARFSCVVQHGHSGTPARVMTDLEAAFGTLSVGSKGDTVAVELPGGSDGRREGWALASYLVANAQRLGIAEIDLAGRRWQVGRASEKGWQHAKDGFGSADLLQVVTG